MAAPSIITTTFDTVRWPVSLQSTFYESALIAIHGPLYLTVAPNKRVLNQAVFSRLFATNIGLEFETDTQTFYARKAGKDSPEPVTTAYVIEVVSKSLSYIASLNPSNFPADELKLPRIKSLIEHIKTVAAFTRLNARETLDEYIRTRLCQKADSNLTVEEIHADYLECVKRKNMSLYPNTKFHVELPQVMLA
jgi:hypothetical protein